MADNFEGHFRAVLEDPEIAQSTKQGTPCVKATVRIVEDGPHKGRRLPWEGWLTEGAGKRTIQSLMNAGCTFPPKPGSEEPDLENFEGIGSKEVEAVISLEEYTPEPTDANPNPRTTKRPRVEFINMLGGASRATKSVDSDTKKLIAGQFGGLISKVRQEAAERKAAKGEDPTSFDPSKLGGSNGGEGTTKKLY